MKMANTKKRLLAVLLSLMMVITLIPAAAIGVNAASFGTIVNGQTVTINYDAGYTTNTNQYVPIYDNTTQSAVNKYYAQLVINNIDGVYACDYDLGTNPAGIAPSSGASVYPTLTAGYDVNALKTGLNAALDQYTSHFEVPTFSAYHKNKLTGISCYYSGSESYKTLYLYVKVTPYTYTFNSDNSYYYNNSVAGTAYYQQIGSVTVYNSYRTTFDLTLSETYGTIASGQSVALIANVPGATNVKYVATAESATGIASITQEQPGVFIITANSLVTGSNKITVFAHQMDSTGTKYVYRSSAGLETTSETFNASGITVNNVKYAPIYDYATVTYSTKSPITAIYLSQSSIKCEVGDTAYIKASVVPTGASGSVNFTSSNPAVAEVNAYGMVTAKGIGTATIYATATDGSAVSAYCTITVSALSATLKLDKTAMNLEVGKTGTLTATLLPTTLVNKTIYWSSSNLAVATVSGGVVKGVKPGTATITATYYTSNGVTKTASCAVTVKEKAAVITADKTLTVTEGETATITASIVNATNKTLLFVSDNNDVAKVDANGKVTAVKPGSAMITIVSAEDSEVKAYCVVTVKKEEVQQTEGIIVKEATYKKGSKYYWTKGVSSAEVKAAIAELKSEDEINVIVELDTESTSNKTVFTRYAISRLSKYADSLTVKVGKKTFTFDSADLMEMANGRPVYVYTAGSKVSVQYKNAAGKYIKFTDLTVEKN